MPANHLIHINDLNDAQIAKIFERADFFLNESVRKGKNLNLLAEKTLVNLFFENSTRTRTSFELAAKKLGAQVVNISVENSSVKKGESLEDTCRTMDSYRPDFLVVRHNGSGIPYQIRNFISCPLINAGDGCHQHPTQSLLDAYVIKNRKGNFKGLNVVICGDILHSRVARSNIALLTRLGAKITVIAPATLMPSQVTSLGVNIATCLEKALENADVLILLRLQQERMSGNFIPSSREYFKLYGLSSKRLKSAKKDLLVLHPGPVNRGVEIEGALVSDPAKTAILQQVEAGVAIRMAVLEHFNCN